MCFYNEITGSTSSKWPTGFDGMHSSTVGIFVPAKMVPGNIYRTEILGKLVRTEAIPGVTILVYWIPVCWHNLGTLQITTARWTLKFVTPSWFWCAGQIGSCWCIKVQLMGSDLAFNGRNRTFWEAKGVECAALRRWWSRAIGPSSSYRGIWWKHMHQDILYSFIGCIIQLRGRILWQGSVLI